MSAPYRNAPIPAGWRLLRNGVFIRAGDRRLNVFETGWDDTELTFKNRIRVGSVPRTNGEPAPYIRRK